MFSNSCQHLTIARLQIQVQISESSGKMASSAFTGPTLQPGDSGPDCTVAAPSSGPACSSSPQPRSGWLHLIIYLLDPTGS